MLESKTNRIALYLSAVIVVILVLFAFLRDNSQLISASQATDLIKDKSIKKVVATGKYYFLKTDVGYYKVSKSEIAAKKFANYKIETTSNANILIYILILIFVLGIGSLVFKYLQNKKNTDKSLKNSETIQEKSSSVEEPLSQSGSVIQAMKSDISFNDIGGIGDVKVELEEIIDFMKNPKRYKDFGARMPKGVLLVGPPGVGKTMIAKAVAHEAGVPFYYQSGASFVQIYVGMGAKKVHDLFAAAKKNAPSIIFIDEIDAVGKKRDGQRNDEREATLNQLLTEMDGFEGSSGVIVVAATNKIDVLDSALLRAGRFDRRIFVELPTKKERESILLKYLEKVPHELDVALIANMTVGFNGAALATLVNEAALLALRENNFHLTIEHFYNVKDKVMFGKKKLRILSEKQKSFRITYQSGKVLVATYFDLPFEKLMLSNEKLTPQTDEPYIKKELEFRVMMLLAGMVACDIKYNEHSNNVKEDLYQAKEIVQQMCDEYGMASSLLPKEDEKELILTNLYNKTEKLLLSLESVVVKIEELFYEKEMISKNEVKSFLDEVF